MGGPCQKHVQELQTGLTVLRPNFLNPVNLSASCHVRRPGAHVLPTEIACCIRARTQRSCVITSHPSRRSGVGRLVFASAPGERFRGARCCLPLRSSGRSAVLMSFCDVLRPVSWRFSTCAALSSARNQSPRTRFTRFPPVPEFVPVCSKNTALSELGSSGAHHGRFMVCCMEQNAC